VACGCGPDGPPTPFYVDLTQVFTPAHRDLERHELPTDAGGWRQVNREGREMMWPIFRPDDSQYAGDTNTTHPTDDLSSDGEHIPQLTAGCSPRTAPPTTRPLMAMPWRSTWQSRGSGMRDSNYLRDSLKAAGAEQADTCALCGAIINRPYEEAHNRFHQADYQPVATATPGVVAETCKLCGILVNRSYQDAHNQVHQADYEPFTADIPGAVAETCKLCGILINPSYQDAHNRSHG
jgi:hypothetical protein